MARRPAFDEDSRERIRRALISYKDAHGVGVPTMQLRIAEALGDPDPDRIPLKSLQRFLAGTHRTDDTLVANFASFLSKVAPPPAEEELGLALSKFLPFLSRDEEALAGFAGSYRSFIRPPQDQARATAPSPAGEPLAAIGPLAMARGAKRQGFDAPWSRLFIEKGDSDSFLRVREIVTGPEEGEAEQEGEQYEPWFGNRGVFVPFGSAQYLIWVSSFIDMRLYLLRSQGSDPATLHGVCYLPQTAFTTLPTTPLDQWQPAFEIALRRDEKHEAK